MTCLANFVDMYSLLNGETIYSIPEKTRVFSSENDDSSAFVLVRSSDLDLEGKEKLGQILNAINLEFDRNVSLFLLEDEKSIQFAPFAEDKKKKPFLLAFGISSAELNFQSNFPLYRLLQFENYNLILSHSIKELMENKTYKGQLWNAIKHLSF